MESDTHKASHEGIISENPINNKRYQKIDHRILQEAACKEKTTSKKGNNITWLGFDVASTRA